ncbi:thaumatin family protein [Archangium minus]|uniref:Thaumatin family protein n=1 Tax=Archangium minus TaxID=83450 RepID=A0ABY9WYY1_9BACT|nr:thaumatin family protein [Archangium minus]
MQQALATDGFNAPMDLKKAGGLEGIAQVLAQMEQVLSMATSLLGGEGGVGGQGLSGLDSLMGGLEGGVPDIGGGVPDIGGAAPGVQTPVAAAPQAPVAQNAPAAKAEGVTPAGGSSKNGNTMTFTNDGTSPMTIKFTPNAGDKEINSVTLKPGEKKTVEFPEGWSGNFRSTSGDGAAATLGEVKFNGGFNQTYYDVSYIEGANASMTIAPEGGGKKSGTEKSLLESAPDSVKAKTADGSVYGIKKTTTSNVQDQGVVDFYRKHVGADEGYVIPTDDASTLGTNNTHLEVHMKDLT